MRRIALVVMVVASLGCGKKKSSEQGSGSGSAEGSGSAAVAVAADAAAIDAAPAIDAMEIGSAGSAAAAAKPGITITNNVAKISVPRMYVEGHPHVDLTMTMPAGWKPYKETYENRIKLVPETAEADRPNMEVMVFMDNIDPADIGKEIDKEIKKRQKEVVGGGKIKVLRTKARPDGKLISLAIDATKERSVSYVQTLCLVSKPGQKFVVYLDTFAEKKDEALVPTFEQTCESIQIVEP